jgi:hypothetical protein
MDDTFSSRENEDLCHNQTRPLPTANEHLLGSLVGATGGHGTLEPLIDPTAPTCNGTKTK